MLTYFLRRLLLAIPTFIGCTLVVFVIVQLAPGGPLQQEIRALKMASAEGGVGGGMGLNDSDVPPEALEELKRTYGFNKPIIERYLSWMGVWPRETNDYTITLGESRKVGGGTRLLVTKSGAGYTIVNPEDPNDDVSMWEVNYSISDVDKSRTYYVFQSKVEGILTGDFGDSRQYHQPVIELIKERLPVSIQFGLIGFVITYVIALYLGVQKALNHKSKFDIASSFGIFALNSLPGWALGALLLMLFATDKFVDVLPLGGMQSPDYDLMQIGSKILDRALHFILPTIAYATAGIASLSMLMKNAFLENLSQDYIRTAYAKGLRENRVIWYHTIRNSIIPLAARAGTLISIFLAGSFLIEYVFNIEGIGKLSFMSVLARDYTVVYAFTVISVVTLLLGNIISDFILALVDPRIRFR